jgi:hypothetical protein
MEVRPMASSPHDMLKGNLRALDRFGALVAVLGEPRSDAETGLLVMLARLLGDEETATLILIVKRKEAK